MNRERISTYLVVCSLAVVFHPVQGVAQQNADPSKAASRPERDGQHDFDFEFGSCKIHLNKLMHPLTGSTKWVEFDGTSVTRKVWDGGAQLEQFETDRPAAGRIEGLTLRMYNPQSHPWRLDWANSKTGIMDPPQVGEFRNGRGEFFAPDTIHGKTHPHSLPLVGQQYEYAPL